MKKSKIDREAENWHVLTERLARSRVRIRLAFIPELMAWLCLIGQRYDRARLAAERELGKSSDEWAKATIEKMATYGEVIQQLLNVLPDPFNSFDWAKVTTDLAREMDLDRSDAATAEQLAAAAELATPSTPK